MSPALLKAYYLPALIVVTFLNAQIVSQSGIAIPSYGTKYILFLFLKRKEEKKKRKKNYFNIKHYKDNQTPIVLF